MPDQEVILDQALEVIEALAKSVDELSDAWGKLLEALDPELDTETAMVTCLAISNRARQFVSLARQ